MSMDGWKEFVESSIERYGPTVPAGTRRERYPLRERIRDAWRILRQRERDVEVFDEAWNEPTIVGYGGGTLGRQTQEEYEAALREFCGNPLINIKFTRREDDES